MSGIGVRDTRRPDPPDRSGLRIADVARLATAGLRGKPARAVLSALGVALGVATMVAVLGISASSRAQLVAEIDSLGTNLLTAEPSPLLGPQDATLPAAALAMAARIGPVVSIGATGLVSAPIYKNDHIPAANTEAISVVAADPGLLGTVEGHLYRGRFLNAATSRYPAAVLGSDAASALGIDQPGTHRPAGNASLARRPVVHGRRDHAAGAARARAGPGRADRLRPGGWAGRPARAAD